MIRPALRALLPRRTSLHFSISASRYNDHRNDVDFSGTLDTDSSIHTMSKILTILEDASKEEAASKKENTLKEEEITFRPRVQVPLNEVSENRFFKGLGNDVFMLNVFQALSKLEVINQIKLFLETGPEHIKGVILRDAKRFQDAYLEQDNGSAMSMEEIGWEFVENPRSQLLTIYAAIRRLCREVLSVPPTRSSERIQFEFPEVRFYNPFLRPTDDPLILRKGLSMTNHPLNLLCIMVDDINVLSEFLNRSRSKVSPILLRNYMVLQSMEGATAFKVLIKKHLRHLETERLDFSPLEGLYQATDGVGSDLDIMKAIVASRSRILTRISGYRDYSFALLSLDPQQYQKNEDVVRILASAFDRYFAICYRLDAKYCDEWVQELIEFYLKNAANEKLFKTLFSEAVNGFRQSIATSAFEKHRYHWERANKKSNSPSKMSSKRNTTPRNATEVREALLTMFKA